MDVGDGDPIQFFPSAQVGAPKKSAKKQRRASTPNRKSKGKQMESTSAAASTDILDTYMALAETMESRVAAEMNILCETVLSRVADFIDDDAGGEELITTAVVELGPNYADHPALLSSLDAKIRGLPRGPVLVRLAANACPNAKRAFKTLMGAILTQLGGADKMPSMSEESDEEESVFASSPSKRRRKAAVAETEETPLPELKDFLSLSQLREFLAATGRGELRLVVVLEDFEAFTQTVLVDLIGLLSSNKAKGLDTALVLGLSTADFAVPDQLSPASVGSLCTRTFQLPAPERTLETALRVAEAALGAEGPGPLWLHHGLLRQLLWDFRWQHYSWAELLRTLKLALLAHLHEKEALLPLWCRDEEVGAAHFPPATIRAALELPSVRRHFESLKGAKPEPANLFADAVGEICEYHEARGAFLRCLFLCLSAVPERSFPRLADLDVALRSPGFFSSEAWESGRGLWAHLERGEVVALLNRLLALLRDRGGPATRLFAQQLGAFARTFADLDAVQAKLDAQAPKEGPKTPLGPRQEKRASRSTIQAQLKTKMERRKDTDALFQQRSHLIRFLSETFKDGLRCPEDLLLNELFLIRPVESDTNLRSEIQPPLLNAPKNVDAGVLFRIYRTITTKSIATADLLRRFLDEIKSDSDDEEKMAEPATPRRGRLSKSAKTPKKTPKKVPAKAAVPEELCTRFFVALAELELLGILKGNERRSGMVQRLFGVEDDLMEEELGANLHDLTLFD